MSTKLITGSIQVKLFAAVLVMFGMLAVAIGLTFNTFGSLQGSAPMVNQAGTQQTRLYEAATLANNYYRADDADKTGIHESLSGVINDFEAVQNGLVHGSTQFDLDGTSNELIAGQLNAVAEEWTAYRSNLDTVLAYDNSAAHSVDVVNETVPNLFVKSAEVVAALNNSQVNPINLDKAGSQRMRAFRIAFLTNTWADASKYDRKSIEVDVRKNLEDFGAIQAGLLDGDADLGLTATSDDQIRSQIVATDIVFSEMTINVESVLSGDDSENVALKRVNNLASDLFNNAASTVNSMNAKVVSLTNADAAGGQRMRAYRTAYLANKFISAETQDERVSIWVEIEEQASAFDAIQNGLLHGDEALGLTATTDPGVIAAIEAANEAWQQYRAELMLVANFNPSALEALASLDSSVGELSANSRMATFMIAADSQGVVGSLKNLSIGLLAFGALLLALMILFIRKTVVAKLRQVTEVAQLVSTQSLPTLTDRLSSVAKGDLTNTFVVDVEKVKVSSSDEVGQIGTAFNSIIDGLNDSARSYNEALTNMSGLIEGVRGTADTVDEAAGEMSENATEAGNATQAIASTSQQVASGAQAQADSIKSSVELINDLTAGIERINAGSTEQTEAVEQAKTIVNDVAAATEAVSTIASEATQGSQAANSAADNGLQIVKQTVDGMDKISNACIAVSDEVVGLGERSSEIGKIVAVIDDIAAQTNLLALNAAIEAARAGDQGRGFAVVADEVRQLAERVSGATSEIADLIDGVQQSVQRSIKATETGAEEVEQGSSLAVQAGEALESILESVGAVSNQIEAMANSALDVKRSSDEMVSTVNSVEEVANRNAVVAAEMGENASNVRSAMEGVADTTEESSAAAEEASASTEELSSQVGEVVSSSASLKDLAASLKDSVSVFTTSDNLEIESVEEVDEEVVEEEVVEPVDETEHEDLEVEELAA